MPRNRCESVNPGERYGRLTAHSLHFHQDRMKWLCACDCGASTFVTPYALKRGSKRSCGCLHREVVAAQGRANAKHGKSASKIWTVWRNMRSRCQNPKHKSYARYGGRGISVCQEWESFPRFLLDMGDPPTPLHELDRIDNNGPYCKGNCRWATKSEQARNRRSSRLITWSGQTKVAAAWASDPRCSVTERIIRDRLRHGWTAERAITAPNKYEAAHA